MIQSILFDFSHVVLLPKDRSYKGGLNVLYQDKLKQLDFNFDNYFELNGQLLNFIETIKDKFKLYVFTFGTIQEAAEIAPTINGVFSKIYSEKYTGYSKREPQSYLKIAEDLGKKPEEILFTDDKKENISAAKQAGFKTIHFKSTKQFIKDFQKMFEF